MSMSGHDGWDRFVIVTANCLLLGTHVLIVMGALQIYIDDDDDSDDNCALHALLFSQIQDFVLVVENGRYGHSPIRSDTSIRVYTTANTDTDTSTPCVGVPATCIIRERSLYAMGGTYRPLATKTYALSPFYDWLICRNVRVIDSWLISLPAGGGSAAWWWPRPVLRRLCNLIPASPWQVSFRLPPLQPSPVSWTIKQHARVRGCLNAIWSSCVMRPVNSWWTCSDARNIGRYNSSRFNTIHPVSVPIRYRSDNRPFSSSSYRSLGFFWGKWL